MTPDDIGVFASAILRAGYALEVDRHEWWPLTPIIGGPAWHEREERMSLGYRAAASFNTTQLPMPYVDDDSPADAHDADGGPNQGDSVSSTPRRRKTHTIRKTQRQQERDHALALALDAIDQGRAPRVLAALEGPYAPLRTLREPYWAPPLPGATWAAYVPAGYAWERPYDGRVVTLDRSGAWITAASSVTVAHGALEHTGEIEFDGAPGYYLVQRHPWYEHDTMPDPLGGIDTTEVWLPHPMVALLSDLAEQGRWADVAILDSWTNEPARLREWAGFTNALRDHAISAYGRNSDEYDRVKTAFSQAVAMLLGYEEPNRRGRAWKCRAHRPDWAHAIQGQAVASQWRWSDDLRRTCPQHAPVALRAIDEIVVPADALPIVTTHDRPGGRKPLKLDPRGVALGSFKIKGEEDWAHGQTIDR